MDLEDLVKAAIVDLLLCLEVPWLSMSQKGIGGQGLVDYIFGGGTEVLNHQALLPSES